MAKLNKAEVEYCFEQLLQLTFDGVKYSEACKMINVTPMIIHHFTKFQRIELKQARKSAKEEFTNQEYLDGFNYLNGNY